MILDSRDIAGGSTLAADVCIIGAGPVGIALATRLNRPGREIIVLESGGATDEAASRRLAGGILRGEHYQKLAETRTRALGGSSLMWTRPSPQNPDGGLRSYPLGELDFAARPAVVDGAWPITLATLRPYYEQAQQLLNLNAIADAATERGSSTEQAAPGLLPRTGRIEETTFHFSTNAGVKARQVSLAESPSVRVILHATVLHLEAGADGREVVAARLGGNGPALSVRARYFLLACGGIENARLLLLSNQTVPGGLGNGEGLVGRYLMEHLTVAQGLIRAEGPDFLDRIARFRHRGADEVEVQRAWRLRPEVAQSEGLLGVVLAPVIAGPEDRAAFARNAYLRPLRRLIPRPGLALRHPGVVAATARRAIASSLARQGAYMGLHAHIEQAPHFENRVTLARRRDAVGQPQALVEWRTGEAEAHALLRTLSILDEELRAAGMGRITRAPRRESFAVLFETTHHHIGTTRMSASPRHGVVDADCRVHGVANLYIAGSSVFPTGGAATVTWTAVALALRLAEHIDKRLD